LKLLEWDSLGGNGSRGYGKVAFTAITRNGEDISSCFAAIQPFAK
jgi:CRISPR-associated protein Csm3